MKFLELLVKLFPTLCGLVRWISGRLPNRGTVLIVEDCANDALILERTLRKIGYDCEIAESGEVAQGILKHGFFSVIFVDLRLPGLSGEALLRVLSDEAPNARHVVVCGEPSDLRECPEGKPIVFIRKSVNSQGLVELFGMLKLK